MAKAYSQQPILTYGIAIVLVLAVGAVFLTLWLRGERQPEDLHLFQSTGAELSEEGRPRFGTDEARPIDQPYDGVLLEKIVSELGKPSSIFDGHYGSRHNPIRRKYPRAKTLYYQWPSGTLYVTVNWEADQWICVVSDWVPVGVVID
jgi:hypothetical protein